MEQWNALVNAAMNLWGPWNVGKFSNSCANCGYAKRAPLHEVSYRRI
jgi:hypothetical protein